MIVALVTLGLAAATLAAAAVWAVSFAAAWAVNRALAWRDRPRDDADTET